MSDRHQLKMEWTLSVGDLLIAITAILGIAASFFTLKSDIATLDVKLSNEIMTRTEQTKEIDARTDYLRNYLLTSQEKISTQLSEISERLARMEGRSRDE